MPTGIEGHRVEASENNVDDNVWTKMKQTTENSNTIDELMERLG